MGGGANREFGNCMRMLGVNGLVTTVVEVTDNNSGWMVDKISFAAWWVGGSRYLGLCLL